MKFIISIRNRIHEVRGIRVMLDRELAELYGTETKALNLAVKRNIKRFPKDFMIQLTKQEWEDLRFQIETSENSGFLRLQIETSKKGSGRDQVSSVCLHRTGSSNVKRNPQFRQSNKNEYCYNACFRGNTKDIDQ